ncbi:hypothetical protein [Microvirus sp.]|nr:hypothetical protein [Microvirus sp.]
MRGLMACPLPPSPLLRWGQWHLPNKSFGPPPRPLIITREQGDYYYLKCNRQVTPLYRYIVVLSI